MKYPNRLKLLRKQKNKSGQFLADALQMAMVKNPTKQKIVKIEKGDQRMTYQEVTLFAKVLECEIKDLVDLNEIEHETDQNKEEIMRDKPPTFSNLSAKQECAAFMPPFLVLYESLSAEAKAELPSWVLNALEIRPVAQLIIPVERHTETATQHHNQATTSSSPISTTDGKKNQKST